MARGPRATITPRRCPRVHLHRVVPSVPSRWSSRPLHPGEILPGQQGRTPTRIARRLSPRGRLTRAMTDSHRAAPPARAASGASTPLQPLRAGWPSGPSPPNAAAAPSLSQWRSELRPPDRGREEVGFPLWGRERLERQRSKARGPRVSDHPRRCPRVLCIVWFGALPPPVRCDASNGQYSDDEHEQQGKAH